MAETGIEPATQGPFIHMMTEDLVLPSLASSTFNVVPSPKEHLGLFRNIEIESAIFGTSQIFNHHVYKTIPQLF